MKDETRISAMEEGPVEAALADYFDRLDRGEPIELTRIIAAHPGCEAGVRQFFQQERKVHNVVAASALVAPPQEGLSGRILGDFRLLRLVGQGGMGVVWEAEQISLGRKVAVKLLPRSFCSDPRHRSRFQNEAKILAQLEHPNIVHVIAVGEESDTYYFAMQLVDGITADDLIRVWTNNVSASEAPESSGGTTHQKAKEVTGVHAPLPSPVESDPWIAECKQGPARYRACARIAAEVAAGLAHAHECGVLHRDVKPSNVLLDRSGVARLSDFGLARMLGDATMTLSGTVLGTLRYASPEQLRGTVGGIDERSDVYSLGVTLWELVTGKRLFTAEDHGSVLGHKLNVEVPRASSADPHVPRDLETVIARAVAREPADRYLTAQAFADDLRRFLEGQPIHAKPISLGERTFRWANRNRALATAAVGSLAILTAVALLANALVLRANSRTATALQASQSNEEIARKNEEAAEASERRTRELLYAADMALAGAAWQKKEPAQVRMILDRYAQLKASDTGATVDDPRGFEWYFLDRQVRPQSELLFENDKALYLVEFMPDGKQFFTAGQDSIVRWHDSGSGKVLRSLDTQQGEVNDVSFNPSATLFVTAGDDGTVKIWNADDLTLIHSIQADHGICRFAKFVDDERVFTGGDVISQQLFDATSGKRIGEFIAPEATARGVVSAGSTDVHVSRISNRAWTRGGSQDNGYDGIYEWDLATGKSRKVYKNNHIRRLLVDRSERYFILIEAGGYVRILDAESSTEQWSTRLDNSLESLALSLDDTQLAVGDDDGQVYVWKLDLENPDSLVTSTTPEKIALHNRQIYSVSFAPDGRSILTTCRDGSAKRVTLAATVEPYRRLDWLTNRADCAAIPGTNFVVATAQLAIYDRSTGQLIKELSPHAHRLLAVSADGNLIAAASSSQIEVWNRTTGERTLSIDKPRSVARSIDFSPNNQFLAVSGDDINVKDFDKPHGCIEVIDVATGASTKYPVLANEVWRTLFCAGDGLIGICGAPNQVALWDVSDGHVRWQTSPTGARYSKIALSSDRNFMVAAQRRSLQLIECATGDIRIEMPCDFTITSLAVLSDGRSFVLGGSKGQVSICNTQTGQRLFEIANLKTEIQSIKPLDSGFLVSTRQINNGRAELNWFEF